MGIRLNWEKRYITLAPAATLLGLAFKLYDPEGLLGGEKNLGITLALIPTDTPGVQIGRRHFPLNSAFLNGPTQGVDVFIPLDYIIGGVERVGQGWRMLMECLAAGRSISLPASSIGGMKLAARTCGAYCRVRKQFNMPIGKFEGVEEPLARIAAHTYMVDAARKFTALALDLGDPAVHPADGERSRGAASTRGGGPKSLERELRRQIPVVPVDRRRTATTSAGMTTRITPTRPRGTSSPRRRPSPRR